MRCIVCNQPKCDDESTCRIVLSVRAWAPPATRTEPAPIPAGCRTLSPDEWRLRDRVGTPDEPHTYETRRVA